MDELYHALNPWWEHRTFQTGILREEYLAKLSPSFKRRQIEIIMGSRRIGKTTFLRQLIKRALEENFPPEQILYLSLDHPRLARKPVSEHLRAFRRMFMHSLDRKLLLFLDEVQDSPQWEAELKSIYDSEEVKILCSGSTSALLESQGGKLTGRQIVTLIYPLSFKEFLAFKNESVSRAEAYKYEKLAEEYLHTGGYPEYVLDRDEDYLINLIQDIIARDIVRLFNVQKHEAVRDILWQAASSVGSRVSFNKLSHAMRISLDTAKDYISFCESAFLLKGMEKWSPSPKNRIYSAKKFYFMDTGLRRLLAGKEDLGHAAENAVFVHLLRQGKNPGYWAESEREVDFVLGTFKKPVPIEVKYVEELSWESKGYAGLKLFLRRHPLVDRATVVTKSVMEELRENNCQITVIPLWKFLID